MVLKMALEYKGLYSMMKGIKAIGKMIKKIGMENNFLKIRFFKVIGKMTKNKVKVISRLIN